MSSLVIRGSKPHSNSKKIVPQNQEKSTLSGKKVSENNGSGRKALPKKGEKSQTSGKTVQHSEEYYKKKIAKLGEKHADEIDRKSKNRRG